MKKIAIFADVQNIYYTTRQAYGRQFNYRKLWQRLSNEGEIVSAIAYATHRGDDKQKHAAKQRHHHFMGNDGVERTGPAMGGKQNAGIDPKRRCDKHESEARGSGERNPKTIAPKQGCQRLRPGVVGP